jgi:hypothetical protein
VVSIIFWGAYFHIVATKKNWKLLFCQCKFEKKIAKILKIKIKITKLSKPQKWKQEPCWQEVADYSIELSYGGNKIICDHYWPQAYCYTTNFTRVEVMVESQWHVSTGHEFWRGRTNGLLTWSTRMNYKL